jgi:hypothetical protein
MLKQNLFFKEIIKIKSSFKLVPRSSGSVTKEAEETSFKTLVSIYQTKRRHIKEDSKRKGKSIPQEAEVTQGDPGRLRPRIFLTFGTTRVVGRQPYAPAAFTPDEISLVLIFKGRVEPRAHGSVGS